MCSFFTFTSFNLLLGSADIREGNVLPAIIFPVYSVTGEIRCTNVTIVGDNSIEDNEFFFVDFVTLNPLDQFYNTSSTEVQIVDDDGKYMYTFPDSVSSMALLYKLSSVCTSSNKIPSEHTNYGTSQFTSTTMQKPTHDK